MKRCDNCGHAPHQDGFQYTMLGVCAACRVCIEEDEVGISVESKEDNDGSQAGRETPPAGSKTEERMEL